MLCYLFDFWGLLLVTLCLFLHYCLNNIPRSSLYFFVNLAHVFANEPNRNHIGTTKKGHG